MKYTLTKPISTSSSTISDLVSRMEFILRNLQNNVKQPKSLKDQLFTIRSTISIPYTFLLSVSIYNLGGQIISCEPLNGNENIFNVRIIDWRTVWMIEGLLCCFQTKIVPDVSDNTMSDLANIGSRIEEDVHSPNLDKTNLASSLCILEYLYST